MSDERRASINQTALTRPAFNGIKVHIFTSVIVLERIVLRQYELSFIKNLKKLFNNSASLSLRIFIDLSVVKNSLLFSLDF